LDTGLAYVDVDSPRFRTQGYEASLATGLGLSLPDTGGRSFFVPLVATGKTYLPLDEARRQALAFRLSAGTLLGFPPESERFFLSGSGAEAFLLRGYEDRKYGGLSSPRGAWSTATTSTSPPRGAPTSTASLRRPWPRDNTGGLKWGVGIGFQLDLDVFGALLPSLRLTTPSAPESPTGRLHFRIGPMF
jgi:outer membrane protein insertion porin family